MSDTTEDPIIFNSPIFDQKENAFISKASENTKSGNFRILSYENGTLQVELLGTSGSFYEAIWQLDEQAKCAIVENGTEWFGDTLNTDTINNIFKQSLQLPPTLPMFPLMNFALAEDCKIFDKRRKKMTTFNLKPNMEVELNFTIDGIYFHKNKCYLAYNVLQIRLLNDNCPTTSSFFQL